MNRVRYGCTKAAHDCEFCWRRGWITWRRPDGTQYRCCALCYWIHQQWLREPGNTQSHGPWNDSRGCNGESHYAAA